MRTACSPPMRLRHLCAYARQHLSRELSSSLLLLLALQLPRHAQTPQATCTAQCSQSCAARLFTMCLSSSEVTKAIPPSRSNILLTLRPAEYHGCCIPAIIEHAWTLRVRRRGIATGGRRGTATGRAGGTPGRIIMVVEASRAERAAPASATSRSWSARNPWRCTLPLRSSQAAPAILARHATP